MTTITQWVLASRPQGMPTLENFRKEVVELPELQAGQVLVRNEVATVDPYMRGRMDDTESYVPPFQIDQPLSGGAVGVVVESKSEKIQVGASVRHFQGWQTMAIVDDAEALVVDTNIVPAHAYLGILGLTGLTAYIGLKKVAEMKEGDVVFISGAAGAVGSAAGQIARHLGASFVIGSAGTDAKVERLKELGFDAAFNYRNGDVSTELKQAAPNGIDVYFDNVGGDHLEAAIDNFNVFGRAALCGAISQYNSEEVFGPRNMLSIIGKCLTLRGFVAPKYMDTVEEFQQVIAPLVVTGQIQFDVTTRHGVDALPSAFLELFQGGNTGKMIVEF